MQYMQKECDKMNESVRQTQHYTIEDIHNLPDGQQAELIDGQIYMISAPGRMHQKLLMDLMYAIENYIRHKDGDCEVYPSPFAVFLTDTDKQTYLEPDLSVVCDKTKLTDEGCKGAP